MFLVEGIPGWYCCDSFYKFAVDRAPTRALFIEVGVLFGSSSRGLAEHIAKADKNIRLVLCDSFSYKNIGHWARNEIKRLKLPPTSAGFRAAFDYYRAGRAHATAELWAIDSCTAAASLPDKSVDFVMLDDNHRAPHIIHEVAWWLPKVKKGGILSAKVGGYIDGTYTPHPDVKAAMQTLRMPLQHFDEAVSYVVCP